MIGSLVVRRTTSGLFHFEDKLGGRDSLQQRPWGDGIMP